MADITMIHTLIPQKSFSNGWAIPPLDIPTGVITGIQLTTTSLAPVYVSDLSVVEGILSFTLVQEESLAGSVHTSDRGPVIIETTGTLIYGVVDIGYIPDKDFKASGNIEINPCRVFYSTSTIETGTTVNGTVDGIPSTTELESDTELELYDGLEGTVSGGTVTIGLSDEGYTSFRLVSSSQIIDNTIVRTINGVSPIDGVISVSISYSGTEIPTTVNNNRVLLNPAATISGCEDKDLIDRYLHPDTFDGVLNKTPLALMYDSNNERNTERLLKIDGNTVCYLPRTGHMDTHLYDRETQIDGDGE